MTLLSYVYIESISSIIYLFNPMHPSMNFNVKLAQRLKTIEVLDCVVKEERQVLEFS